MRHRVRDQLVGRRTALLNGLRGHLSEIRVVAAQGAQNAYRLVGHEMGGPRTTSSEATWIDASPCRR